MLAILLVVALALPLVFSPVATNKVDATAGCSADTIYVDVEHGSDSYDGLTWATARKYIQSGIDIVCTDGTVYVATGVYNENLHIGKSFNLSGAGALTTIIDGSGLGRVLDIASYEGQANTISGFTIQNGHIRTPAPTEEGALLGAGPGMAVGGGVYVAYGHVVILNDCTIRNNTADFMGGGVYNAGEITLNRCTLSGNSAAMVGGGIANFVDMPGQAAVVIDVSNATMTLINCTISGNSVTGASVGFARDTENANAVLSLSLGGGVYNGGVADFLNVTIANNTVPDFLNVTIANNTVPVSITPHGGGFANVPLQCANNQVATPYTPVATFKNTLVAGNVPDNGYYIGGTVTSHGYNLDSQNTCGFNQSTDQFNTPPGLVTLQNNGGPTSTRAITASSPAFNKGTNVGAPSTDQRGITRPQAGAYDIGAFELSAPAPTVTSCNPNQGTQGQCPNTVIITGTNFTGATAVSFGAGINSDNFTYDSPTQITAVICIAADAACGTRNVSVTTPFGTGTGTALFTVTASPTVTTVTPASGNQGQCPKTVIITGTNFTGATAVSFGAGITSSFVVNSATQITATICIDANATPGARNVSVTTLCGTATLTGGFTVIQQNQSIGTGALTSHGSSVAGGTTYSPPVSLPNLVIQSASLSSKAVTPGMPVTVTADIANKSTVNGNKKVTLYVNGQVESTQGVTVNSGGSSKLTFNVSRSEPGEYNVYVDGVPAGSFNVELFRESDGILIFSAVLVAMAFILGMVMLGRRQRAG